VALLWVAWGAVLLAIGAMGSAADAIYHLLACYMTAPGMDEAALVPLILAFFVGAATLAVSAAGAELVSRRNPWLHAAAVAVALSAPLWARGNPAAARAVGLTVLALVSLSLAGIGLGLAPELTPRRLAVETIVGVLVVGIATFVAGERTEVVVLRTRDDAGTVHGTKMWCVDHEGAPWVRVANPGRYWYQRLLAHPDVELVRHGEATARTAHPDPAPATRLALAFGYGLNEHSAACRRCSSGRGHRRDRRSCRDRRRCPSRR
jgi:hypothetical protein